MFVYVKIKEKKKNSERRDQKKKKTNRILSPDEETR